jgi:hypothetical protein
MFDDSVGDRLNATVHVAQTARRESHSRALAVLQESERGAIEWQRDERSNQHVCIGGGEDGGHSRGNNESADPEDEAATPLDTADVRNTCIHEREDSRGCDPAPFAAVRGAL